MREDEANAVGAPERPSSSCLKLVLMKGQGWFLVLLMVAIYFAGKGIPLGMRSGGYGDFGEEPTMTDTSVIYRGNARIT